MEWSGSRKVIGKMPLPLTLSIYTHPFKFPPEQEPEWKNLVERWYQMDAAAYGVTAGYWSWKQSLSNQDPPDFLILASPSASNETDLAFAKSGASSPQKFVHTLANIRCSPLCQVMGWSGPMLCFTCDPETLARAMGEAFLLLQGGEAKRVWIVSIFREQPGLEAKLFQLELGGSLSVTKQNASSYCLFPQDQTVGVDKPTKSLINIRDFWDPKWGKWPIDLAFEYDIQTAQ